MGLTLLLVVGDGAWLLMAQVIQTRSSHAHQVGPTALLRPERTAVDADRFTGGRVADVLGGVTLDLRDAEPAPGGAEVIATSILGSVEVIAPPDWETRVSGIPVLGVVTGGTPARGSPEGMPARTAAPDLVVKGRALLGVVEVRASE